MSIVRVYDSEQRALDAATEAEQAGFVSVYFLAASAASGREREAVQSAAREGCVSGGQVRVCIEALQRGRSVVAVAAPYGRGQLAEQILGRHGPVAAPKGAPRRNPAPFSEILGLPVLSSDSTPASELSQFQHSFGEPKLSRNPAPLSSRFGMKTLTTSKEKRKSFGMSLLSRNGTPLSSAFRIPVLSRPKSKMSSFGMPLLSKNPAPISGLFGIRVLSKNEKRGDDRG